MTSSRKDKSTSTHRAASSRHSGKRKAGERNSPTSSPPKRPRPSISDLLSLQHSHSADARPATDQSETVTNSSPNTMASRPSTASFADMYTFTSSKPTATPSIDLTNSGSPQSSKRNGEYGAQRMLFNPQQGPKKLVVKNFRTATRTDPQQYLDQVWAQEDKALDSIFRSTKEPFSLEELYKSAEHVCRQGKAAELNERLQKKCDSHLRHTVREDLRREVDRVADVEVLRVFVDAWSTWQHQLLTVRQIFYYMDQTYLLRSADHPSLTEMGLVQFRTLVFQDEDIKTHVLSGVVDLFASDRMGTLSDKNTSLLRQAVDALHELGIYTAHFEPIFQAATEQYFRTWRETEANKGDLAAYVNNCTELLAKEMARCDFLTLDRNTRAQISTLFDTILIGEETAVLIDPDSILTLLEDDRYEEMGRLYALLQRKGIGEAIAPSFSRYIETEGTLIVFDEKRQSEMVLMLLDFKRRLDQYLKVSFHKNETLGNALHKAFETFINKTKKTQSNWDTDNAKPGEMIAKHVDLLLKGGVKAIPRLQSRAPDASKPEDEHDFDDAPADEDAEINQHLSNALDLFRFVHGKAVFEAFYKKDLARRLLMGRSASFDAERNMLTRLKNECGAAFTHNLESMFKDMDLAREEMLSYNQLLDDRGTKGSGPDLHVNVLSAAAWPTYPDAVVNIPPAISRVMTDFEAHYKSKHSGRKLTWKHSLAHCQLRAQFPRGNKELVVSGFQAMVLLLFNDQPLDKHLSYGEIKASTGLVHAELRRTLQSLACAKYQVLKKHPKGRDVNDTDTFTFSAGFADPKMRIKINQIQLKETKEENKETHHRVAADRHYETQAAIVRIMKSRKKIGHNDLIVEVIKATMSRGVLDQADIKRNIEKLIEKDYMERTDGNSYAYVA